MSSLRNDPSLGVIPENLGTEQLGFSHLTREQMVRMTARVLAYYGDSDAETLTQVGPDARGILFELFGRTSRPPQRTKQQADSARRTTPPETPEEHEEPDLVRAFLDAVFWQEPPKARVLKPWEGDTGTAKALRGEIRAWGRAEGHHVYSRGLLNPGLVAAFKAANPGRLP